MSFFNAILIALNFHTPVAKADINEVDRLPRLENIAHSIEIASNKATCSEEFKDDNCKPIFGDRYLMAGMILSLGKNETYFEKSIGAGECTKHSCGGKIKINGKILFKAASYWQIEKVYLMALEEFESFIGLSLDNIIKAAIFVSMRLAGSYYVCGGIEGAFAGYAKSQTNCKWEPAKQRTKDALYYRSVIVSNLNE